jgi:hypothetical protein
MNEKLKRPGRKIGAEKRRAARAVLVGFSLSEEYFNLPGKVKAAIRTFCPEIEKAEAKLNASGFDFTSYESIKV